MASYALWRQELKTPTPDADRQHRGGKPESLCGFWMIDGARTKPAYPVAIFPQDDRIIFKIGVGATDGESLFGDDDERRLHDFMTSTWFKCVAVTDTAYHAAMESGRWADGRPARKFSEAEKLGLEPATPPEQGGNMPPEEAEADLDNQIITKIEAELKKIPDVKFPLNKESAEFAATIVDRLRGLGKQGEPRRKAQKQPHMDAAAAVDAHWSILKDASAAIERMVTAIAGFTKAEEARLRREQEESLRVERERIRKETEDRAREAAEQAEREALARGEAFEVPTEEAIAEQVEAEVEQQIAAAPPVEAPKVVVRGSEQSRAISKAKRKVGKITDVDAFIASIKDQADFREFLQTKADKLARANTALKGMEITED
jgi:hypothetical protein